MLLWHSPLPARPLTRVFGRLLPGAERGDLLRKLAGKIEEEKESMAQLESLDTGKTVEESRLANNTIYGLAAGFWTNDDKCKQRVSGQLRFGTVWINDFNVFLPRRRGAAISSPVLAGNSAATDWRNTPK
jgi:acyl-CoA reductase-like NAD-dependent aldehyde dehydrogenase